MKTSFPKDRIRVLLLEGVHPRAGEVLAGEGFRVEQAPGSVPETRLRKEIKGVHLLGIRSRTGVTQRVLDAADRLLAVGCFCIGVNQVDTETACDRAVPVFNAPFSNTRSVAELTISEIIALHRRLFEKSALMHSGKWVKSASGAHEVRARTLGIVGYGRIGSQVSVLAEALGMRVIFYDILPRLALGNAQPARSLRDLLERSDVVTIHVPATEQTRDMIGPAQIRAMKDGAFLINNARGSIVDVEALADALREGKLAGAALDVFPEEPAAGRATFDSPLRGIGNVILTPHVGGSTEEAQCAIAEDVAAKLLRFVNNGATVGAVNVPEVDLPEQSDVPATVRGKKKIRPHRILHFHRNVPGVLRNVHAAIADLGANVAAEYLRTNERVGYAVLDVDPSDGAALRKRIERVPETIRVRVLW